MNGKIYFFCALCLLAAPSKVMAFAGPPPDPGITQCYDNASVIECPDAGQDYYGQDAQFINHVRSYTKVSSRGNSLPDNATSWVAVRDDVTGLYWELKSDNASADNYMHETYTQLEAQVYINELNAEHFGNRTDWRLPTFKELQTIIDSGRFNPAIDPTFFPNTVDNLYWTGTSFYQDTTQAWLVHFGGGSSNYDAKTNAYRVRAVGSYTIGPYDESPSFFANNDGTISDTEAGLMWQQSIAPGDYTWKQALAYCSSLTLAGHADWRLPDKNELHVLAQYSTYNPARDKVYFPNTDNGAFWTASTNAESALYAWLVDFYFGSLNNGNKNDSYDVRAVRTPAAGYFTYLTVTKSGTGTGTVESQGSGINCGTDCAQTYDSAITLSATPDTGCGFTGWSYNNCAGTGDCEIEMTGMITADAVFSLCVDSDNDSFLGGGRGCDPADCDDADPTNTDNCSRCADNDGDGYGEGQGCIGPDCDDGDTNLNVNCSGNCTDTDGDSYFAEQGCTPRDCDDSDAALTDNCTGGCTVKLQPAKISRLVSLLLPLRRIVIRSQDGAVFPPDPQVDWGSASFETLSVQRRTDTTIVAWVRLKPLQLQAKEEITVTAGGCTGELTIRGF